MATETKLAEIRPDVKAMIDNVVVPILVREFLEVLRKQKGVEVAIKSVPPYSLANTVVAEKVAG
jgi:hypothetical protein